jgi:hypothetical protein
MKKVGFRKIHALVTRRLRTTTWYATRARWDSIGQRVTRGAGVLDLEMPGWERHIQLDRLHEWGKGLNEDGEFRFQLWESGMAPAEWNVDRLRVGFETSTVNPNEAFAFANAWYYEIQRRLFPGALNRRFWAHLVP